MQITGFIHINRLNNKTAVIEKNTSAAVPYVHANFLQTMQECFVSEQ